MTSERRNVVVFIKQSSLCFREVDLHAYFTQPVLQVSIAFHPSSLCCDSHNTSSRIVSGFVCWGGGAYEGTSVHKIKLDSLLLPLVLSSPVHIYVSVKLMTL